MRAPTLLVLSILSGTAACVAACSNASPGGAGGSSSSSGSGSSTSSSGGSSGSSSSSSGGSSSSSSGSSGSSSGSSGGSSSGGGTCDGGTTSSGISLASGTITGTDQNYGPVSATISCAQVVYAPYPVESGVMVLDIAADMPPKNKTGTLDLVSPSSGTQGFISIGLLVTASPTASGVFTASGTPPLCGGITFLYDESGLGDSYQSGTPGVACTGGTGGGIGDVTLTIASSTLASNGGVYTLHGSLQATLPQIDCGKQGCLPPDAGPYYATVNLEF